MLARFFSANYSIFSTAPDQAPSYLTKKNFNKKSEDSFVYKKHYLLNDNYQNLEKDFLNFLSKYSNYKNLIKR